LLVEKGIITKDEVMAQLKGLNREMQERGGRVNISWVNITWVNIIIMDYCIEDLIGKIGLYQNSCLDPPWMSLHISIRNRSISFLP